MLGIKLYTVPAVMYAVTCTITHAVKLAVCVSSLAHYCAHYCCLRLLAHLCLLSCCSDSLGNMLLRCCWKQWPQAKDTLKVM